MNCKIFTDLPALHCRCPHRAGVGWFSAVNRVLKPRVRSYTRKISLIIRAAIRKNPRNTALRDYLIATAAVLAALVLRLLIDPWLRNTDAYTTFFLAVVFSSLFTRVGSSVYAALLGACAAYFCFVPPRYRWGFAGTSDAAAFLLYLVAAGGVLLLAHARNRAKERMESNMAALEESETRFRMLADNMAQFAWMADEKGRRYWYNLRWLEYTGIPLEQAQGNGWRKAQHPDHVERVSARMQHSWDTGEPWEDTYPLLGADGHYRWFLSRAVPIHNASGQVVRWFGTNTDVTDRVDVENALRRSEKLAAAGKLAASVAHELNSPLGAAVNLAFLARSEPNDATRSLYLEGVERELKRASILANRTLSFYRDMRSGAAAVREVAAEAASVFQSQCLQRRIKIVFEIGHDASVNVSRGELSQVIVNLLSNAIDAIGSDGMIRVRAAARGAAGEGRRKVHLIVADSGCGIDPQYRDRIFDPFFTTKGTVASGLGLWVTKDIVLKHGGAISVRSRFGAGRTGTTVLISLPAQAAAHSSAEPALEPVQELPVIAKAAAVSGAQHEVSSQSA